MHKLLSTTALMLVLAVSGAACAQDKGPPHEGPHAFMDQALAKLPPADADKFREAMKQAHAQDRATMEQIHALHQELDALLKAPTFDKAAFLKKSAELQHLEVANHTRMTKAFADAVATLPQDERATLADSMHPAHHGPHEHGPEHGPDHDDAPQN